MIIHSYIFSFSNKSLGYLLRCFIFVFMVVALQAVLFVVLPRNRHSYNRVISHKIRALEKDDSKKIILVGGSNLAFGIDSERLQGEMGLPVYNTSHHAGLGISYMLRLVDPHLNSGDIVVLSLEYELFSSVPWSGDSTLAQAVFDDMSLLRYAGVEHIVNVCIDMPEIISEHFLRILFHNGRIVFYKNSIYNESACNMHGDVISHLGKVHHHMAFEGELPEEPCDELPSVYKLGQVLKQWNQRGVIVVLIPPYVPSSLYKEDQVYMESLFCYIRNNVSCVSPLAVSESVLLDEYFYDTLYHLTGAGRQLRTEQLVDALISAD